MTYSLGVDLGTTTSAAAFRRGARLEVCPLGDLTATMPSATWERPDGSMSVGDEAAAAARFDTALMARHVIARLAHGSPIAVDGRAIDPVRSMQALLATVVDRAQRLYGQAPRETVITHPLVPVEMATVLARAAELTVGPALLVPHPIAAAAKLSRDADLAMGSTVAVLDFGGSSFEVAIVRRTPQGFDLVGAPGGLSDFGGIEIDDMVFARVDAVLGHPSQSIRPDDGEGMAALWRLRAACRAAKERLTTDAEATVDVTLPGT